ncbi:hypothetical protein, partial [Bradyrhizobium genomosp. III]
KVRSARQLGAASPNTMVAFAAKAGSTASDGDSSNSRFAAALVEQTLAVRDNHAAASIDAATLKDALQ